MDLAPTVQEMLVVIASAANVALTGAADARITPGSVRHERAVSGIHWENMKFRCIVIMLLG